jgi:hypothetical protein
LSFDWFPLVGVAQGDPEDEQPLPLVTRPDF